jgi:membrane protein implicated in regulation of membrane protease activity
METSEVWRWIWLAATVLLAAGELAVPGTFFLLSFALGAAIATVVAFVDGSLLAQWACFLVGSGIGLVLLVPLGRRLAATETDEAQEGAGRWVGRVAEVLEEIPGGPHATGRVRVERDVWRAETDDDRPISAGARVEVIGVRGTRLVVVPMARHD